MIDQTFTKWQKRVLNTPDLTDIPLYQKKNVFYNMLQTVLLQNENIYYLLPELIDFVESNALDYRKFLNTIFLLRDQIMSEERVLEQKKVNTKEAQNILQDIIIKIGSYFNHRRMDLNVGHSKVPSLDSKGKEATIFQLDERLVIEKSNSGIFTTFGYEKNEVIGKPLTLLFSSSSNTIIKQALNQLKNNMRYKTDLEVEAQCKSGQTFQALLKISRLQLDQKSQKYSAYIQDNTYIYETKSMLNLLSMALEGAGEGIILFEPDPSGKILYVNEAIEKMSGYTRNKLLGKPLSVLRNSSKSDTLEAQIIEESMKNGWKGEIENHHKNGHSYIVSLHTQPVKDEYGEIIALVGIERDISEQKQYESKIIHLQKFVEHIINNLQHFVIVTDKDLNIKFWNQSLEKAFNIQEQNVINQKLLEVLPELRKFNVELAAQSVLKSREPFTKKFLCAIADTEEKYYQLYITPISTEESTQILLTILDITKEELLKVRITWQNARLKFLENFSQLLNKNLALQSIFESLTNELTEIFPFKNLSFLLPYNLDKLQFYKYYQYSGKQHTFPRQETLDLSDFKQFKELVDIQTPLLLNLDSLTDTQKKVLSNLHSNQEFSQSLHFAVVFEKEVLGVLNISDDSINQYTKNDVDFLQQIALHLAISIKNSFYFNQIELQNKKLSVVNSIFNTTQKNENIAAIYKNALIGLKELLVCDEATLYQSYDNLNWEKIDIPDNDNNLPLKLTLEASSIKGQSTYWDNFQPLSNDYNLTEIRECIPAGLLSYNSSNSQQVLFLSSKNKILDQINPDFIESLIQDILKQLTIALDQIDLFTKIKQAEEEWESTFNTVNIGLVIVDENFCIKRTNNAFHKLFHIKSPQEIHGLTCEETFCGPAEEQNCFKEKIFNETTKVLNDEYLDTHINKTINRTFFPIFNKNNKFKGGVFSIYDMTEQRQQETKIKFLSKFPETNPNLVFNITNDGNLNYMNPAARRLLTELNLTEKEYQQILPGNLKSIIKNFETKNATHLELDHKFQDHVLQYIIYRPEEDNNFYFYGSDITDRVELQNQLLQTERIRAVGEMAAGVAHDFNNLLATILGRTQLLLLKNDNDTNNGELEIIEKAAIEGGQIVRRLQEVTRERKELNFQPIDINELIKESIIFTANKLKISTQLKDKKVQLQTNFCEDAIVKGEAVELKEVFTNLLLNAYDAMPNGGELNISTQKSSDHNLQITFKDSGLGMPEEIRDKIFNPFFTTKGEKGTGLGLSITYRTITSHGGNIRAESEMNEGTKFIIHLPLSKEPLKQKQESDYTIYQHSGDIQLLIVDDEPELLETMAEILRLKFKTVEIASSGHIALQKIEQQNFDVVLTDLGMPEMSGWELARQVKQKLVDSHVILVTGWGEQAREELKHHPYVDEILPKPYELRDLISKINQFYQEETVSEK